jgi:hypothetical protein
MRPQADFGALECPFCGLEVPLDRMSGIQTPYGVVTVCYACHPDMPAPAPDRDPTGEGGEP